MVSQSSLFDVKTDCINYDISPNGEDLCIKRRIALNRTDAPCYVCSFYIPFYPGKPMTFYREEQHNEAV